MGGPHIGQVRVSFQYDRCSEATIIAQQIVGEKDEFTFRKWNPDKLNVAVGQKTEQETEEFSYFGFMCCYMCMCVDGWMSFAFEEVIDHAADGTQTAKSYFNNQEGKLVWSTRMTRICGILLAVAGLWMIFTPIIAVLNWIPLIGTLLGGVAALASFLFALLVGTTVSLLVIATAWLFFRPCMALSLLTLVGVGTYMIF